MAGRIEIRLGRKVPATGQVRDFAVPAEPTPNPKNLHPFSCICASTHKHAISGTTWGRGALFSAKGRRLGACDPAIEARQRGESAGLSWSSESCWVVCPSITIVTNRGTCCRLAEQADCPDAWLRILKKRYRRIKYINCYTCVRKFIYL